jgi:hypothetical protein
MWGPLSVKWGALLREGESMDDWKGELLKTILDCGSLDLDRLGEILAIAKKLEIPIEKIVDLALEYSKGSLRFEDIAYSAMWCILLRIAWIADEMGEHKVAEKLRQWNIYVNYIDTHFNINALDRIGIKEAEKLEKEEIIRQVIEEVKTAEVVCD